MIPFFDFVTATFVTMVLIPPLVRLARRYHVVDVPTERKVHARPIARVGGIAMAAGAIAPLLVWLSMDREIAAVLCGVAIILAFGVWDDLKDLGYRAKFLGQLVAVSLVVVYGGIVIRYVPFLGLEPLPDAIAIPLTVIALVGVTNAVNLADGLDGLAGGIVVLSLGVMAMLAYGAGATGLLLGIAAVMGSVVGFLRFNTYPAQLFMGDAGSQFLGFSLGVFVIALTQDANTALSPALPLLILGLPLLDTVLVIVERIREGRSPFSPDKKHLHHKLLALGFNHYEAVLVIYVLQAILVSAAYLLRFESDWLLLGFYALFCAALVGSLIAARARAVRIHGHPSSHPAPVPPWIQWLRQDLRLLKFAFYLALIAILCYFLLGAMLVERVPGDIAALAWLVLAVQLFFYFKHWREPFSIVEKAGAYLAAICVVYLSQVLPGALVHLTFYRNLLFAVMVVAVAIGFRLSKERFRVTPMDFLVIFSAVIVPKVADVNGAGNLGLSIAILIVLFYAIELVLNNIWRRWDVMRIATCLTLAVLGLRGIVGAIG